MRHFGPGLVAALSVIALAGFTREYTASGGTCVAWATRTPHYSVNLKGSAHLSGQPQFTAVQNAFSTWSTPTCTDMAPVDDGTTPRSDITYDPDAGATDPNVNLVVWRPKLCSAVVPDGGTCEGSTSCDDTYNCLDDGDQEAIAVTTFFARTDTGGMLQAGIELNDFYYVFTTVSSPVCDFGCTDDGGVNVDGGACGAAPPTAAQSATAVNWPCVVFDVQDILTHEVGHFLGFGQSTVAGSAMSQVGSAGELSKRTLGTDDQSAVCDVYPKGDATPAACDAGPAVLPKASGCGCSPAGGDRGSALWVFGLTALAVGQLFRRRARS